MQFPLSLSDFSLFLLSMALILLVTSEMISPYYGQTGILIDRKRLRTATFLLFTLFLTCAAFLIYRIILSVM